MSKGQGLRHLYSGENVVIVSGLPGAGKTLFTVSLLRELGLQGRPVYTCGVNGVSVPEWHDLEDGKRWHELAPDGAIVLVDEAQRVFEPAGPGQKMAPHLDQMNTIRHRGITLVLTTQNPMLLHANVRRLCQRHFHVVRRHGWERATLYHWPMCADVGTRSALLSSVKSSSRLDWSYPKESFALYKSAEVHTMRKRLPWQLWAALFALPLVGLLAWVAWASMNRVQHAGEKFAQPLASAAGGGSGAVQGTHPMTTREYVAAYQPRVADFPQTAPIYDKVTEPDEAPYPAACVSSGTRCQCYSQQGTRLSVGADTCRSIVERGFFKGWGNHVRDVASAPRAAAPAATVAPEPSGTWVDVAGSVKVAPVTASPVASGAGGKAGA